MSALDLALHYAVDLGWPVFPLAPRSKKPATAHGFRDATTDGEQIAAWWGARSPFGVAAACTRLVVLDVDTKDGKGGLDSLAELEAEHGPLPETWRAITPSGGRHFFFAARPGREVRRSLGVRPGIDVCGVGGYVALAPTVTDVGAYEWIETDALAVAPLWLCELAKPTPVEPSRSAPRSRWSDDVEARARRAVAYVSRIDPAIAGAGGHDHTFDVARALVRGFELPLVIAREILADYSARCVPPWSAREIEHKLADASHARLPSGYLLEGRT